MPSARTLDFRHSPGSFRPFALCRAWSRSGLGGAAPGIGAGAAVPGTRAPGRRTMRFADWGQNPMHLLGWGVRMALGLGRWTVRKGFTRRTNGGRRDPRRRTEGQLHRWGRGKVVHGASRGALSPPLPHPRLGSCPPVALRGPRRPPFVLRVKNAESGAPEAAPDTHRRRGRVANPQAPSGLGLHQNGKDPMHLLRPARRPWSTNGTAMNPMHLLERVAPGQGLGRWTVRQRFTRRTNGGRGEPRRRTEGQLPRWARGKVVYGALRGAQSPPKPYPRLGSCPPVALRGPRRPPFVLRVKNAEPSAPEAAPGTHRRHGRVANPQAPSGLGMHQNGKDPMRLSGMEARGSRRHAASAFIISDLRPFAFPLSWRVRVGKKEDPVYLSASASGARGLGAVARCGRRSGGIRFALFRPTKGTRAAGPHAPVGALPHRRSGDGALRSSCNEPHAPVTRHLLPGAGVASAVSQDGLRSQTTGDEMITRQRVHVFVPAGGDVPPRPAAFAFVACLRGGGTAMSDCRGSSPSGTPRTPSRRSSVTWASVSLARRRMTFCPESQTDTLTTSFRHTPGLSWQRPRCGGETRWETDFAALPWPRACCRR
jgi:hypothetical protein